MFWDDEVTPEDEEAAIKKAVELIHKYGLDTIGIISLETVKPLAYIGGQLGRFTLAPILPFFGEKVGRAGNTFFTVFEKRENVEKVIQLLEKKAEEEKTTKKKTEFYDDEEAPKKKGWRRFLPF